MSHDPPSTVSILTDSFEPPERIGPYRLLDRKPIGAGGMGEVYLAEQDTPRRRVALKIIKLGMDSREVIRRFEQEREALGLMEHPNVARIYDARATPEGRPYFVMEYVRGVPITRHCDEQRLTIRQRIELFIAVCDGIQHAHQKAIIHRDVTPRNVLVEFADGKATPKVIDFGLAKALGARLTDGTLSADLGGFKGTLPYSSPEQAGGNRDIDTRTDIYSLGALLYELLAGVPPIDFTPDSPLDERLRRIREAEPLPPSVRVRQRATEGEEEATEARGHKEGTEGIRHEGTKGDDEARGVATLAHTRRTDPRALMRELRNEPDWIVMKCLEKERGRRYESVSALVADIRRYLAGETVLARAPSVLYRLRKFVVRHRVPVIAAAVFVVALSSLTGWALSERARAEEQTRVAKIETANAQREKNKAEAVNDFVTKALISSDPNQLGKQDFTVMEALDQAIKLLEAGGLKDQPETEAGLCLTIAQIIDGNGRPDDALRLAQRALKINEMLHLGDHPDVALSLNSVACRLDSLSRSAEALPKYEYALVMRQRLFHGDHPDLAKSLNDVALCLESLGRSGEALSKFQEALAMRQRLFHGDDPDVASSMSYVAHCLDGLGRSTEALAMIEEALAMYQRLFPGDHPDVARALNSGAGCLKSLGRSAEALAKYEEALAMRRRLFRRENSDVAVSLNDVATCLNSLGRFAEALPKFEESLAMSQHLFPGDHEYVATCLNNVAFTLDSLGRSAEALPKYEEALAIYQRLFPGDHPHVAGSLNNVAACLQSLKRFGEALPRCERALAMQQRLFRGDHRTVATSLNNTANCLRHLDRFAEAVPMYEEALAMFKRVLPPGHPNIVYPQIGLSDALRKLDRFGEAEPLLLDSAAQCERSAVSRPIHWGSVAKGMVQLYEAWHAAEPGKGYDVKAAEWRAKLEEWRASTQPAATQPATGASAIP